MTDPGTGAGGTAVRITAGQHVFVGPLSHEGKAGLTEHQDFVMELDDNHLIPVNRESIHPWHECLPAVGAWLNDNPDGAIELWAHLDDLGEEQETPRLRSLRDALRDALSTDGGA